jgi:hypothetical protein
MDNWPEMDGSTSAWSIKIKLDFIPIQVHSWDGLDSLKPGDRFMSSEIDKAIELIEERIAALQKVRETLVEMFDAPDSLRRRLLKVNDEPKLTVPSTIPAVSLLGSGNGNAKVTRKDQVAKFIREHGGSATRSEIIAGTGIPTGTVAYVLNDEARFRARDGKWYIVEQRDSVRTSAE